MKQKNKKINAFSLVELSITILILGVIISAIVGSKNILEKAQIASNKLKAQNISNVVVPEILYSKQNKFWIDAKNINGNYNAGIRDNDYIDLWKDLSGFNNNAFSLTNDRRPKFDRNENAVHFFQGASQTALGSADGDFLTVKNSPSMNTNAMAGDSVYLFAIYKLRSTSTLVDNTALFGNYYNNGSNTLRVHITKSQQVNYSHHDGSSYLSITHDKFINDQKYHLISFGIKKNLNKGFIAIDGIEKTATIAISGDFNNPTQNYVIGGGHFNRTIDGYLKEMIYLNKTQLSQQDIYDINYYLSKKWELTGTVDSDSDGKVDNLDSKPTTPN